MNKCTGKEEVALTVFFLSPMHIIQKSGESVIPGQPKPFDAVLSKQAPAEHQQGEGRGGDWKTPISHRAHFQTAIFRKKKGG